MKIMTIKVPDDSVEFVEEFVERIGGNVEEKELVGEKPKREKKVKTAKEKSGNKKGKIDHTFMFGKWKDFDIDAKKLREEAWGRKF